MLPAMDDDSLRRGQPTCHVVFGEAHAILAGDALLTLAFEWLACFPVGPGLEGRRLQAVRRVAAAAGAEGMVGGQTADLEGPGAGGDPKTVLAFIHQRKTAALLGAAVALGGVVGGLDASAVDRLDAAPVHPKAADADDPLHAARAAEVTSLWRLRRDSGGRSPGR